MQCRRKHCSHELPELGSSSSALRKDTYSPGASQGIIPKVSTKGRRKWGSKGFAYRREPPRVYNIPADGEHSLVQPTNYGASAISSTQSP